MSKKHKKPKRFHRFSYSFHFDFLAKCRRSPSPPVSPGSLCTMTSGCVWLCTRYFFEMFPQTVCPHYGVLTVGVRSGVLPQPRLSTAQARTEFRLRRQYRAEWLPRDFGSFYRVSVQVLRQNVVLRDRCRRSDGFGGSKRELTWQNRTLCENRGRRSILWTLPKLWQACVIRRIAFYVAGAGNPDHGCYVRRARFLRRVAFLELELEDQFAWPVQHFVRPRVMISWQAQYFWNMFPFSWKSRRKRSFWKSGSSAFEEVSQKTLVLEVWHFSFRGSLAENAHFGAPDEVSHETFVLEVRKSRIRRSFWKYGSPVFEEVSRSLLVYKILMQVAQKDPNTGSW